MLFHSQQIYEQAVANPGALTTGILPVAYIYVGDYERFQFKVAIGSTNNDLDAQVVQATDSAGTSSKVVTGAAITQLESGDGNKQAVIEVETRKLDLNNGFDYVAVSLTAAGTTTGYVEFRGINPGYAPVTQPTAFEEQVFVGG